MKRVIITLLILLAVGFAKADTILIEGFEYGNHDGETPVGWITADDTWLCGYQEQDHNRKPHTGNWYAYTNSTESWMFMELNLSDQLKYRFKLWAVSDGGYQLNIWAGDAPDPSAMTRLLLDDIVSSSNYEQFYAYIDDLTAQYQYIGIHAVCSYGDRILTIDDIVVEMVDKYGLDVTPQSMETNMAPGTQTEFKFKFTNTGYEPATVIIDPNSEFFNNIHILVNGTETHTFHAEPNETFDIQCNATMLPDITDGSLCWIDIMFRLDCDCATTMFTFWATAGIDAIQEHCSKIMVYPNPSNGDITIEGSGTVTISNMVGQVVLQKEIIEKEIVTLKKGIYLVRLNDKFTTKLIISK